MEERKKCSQKFSEKEMFDLFSEQLVQIESDLIVLCEERCRNKVIMIQAIKDYFERGREEHRVGTTMQ